MTNARNFVTALRDKYEHDRASPTGFRGSFHFHDGTALRFILRIRPFEDEHVMITYMAPPSFANTQRSQAVVTRVLPLASLQLNYEYDPAADRAQFFGDGPVGDRGAQPRAAPFLVHGGRSTGSS